MSCWAAMYTMMYNWRHNTNVDVPTAVASLGPKYVRIYDNDTGLPITGNRELARVAGMTAEPLYNPSIRGWANLLRSHGPLWTSYGWQVFDKSGTEVRAGRHIIIIHGIMGDGTAGGTQVLYVDPSDGAFHRMTVARFVQQHETGFAMRKLPDQTLGEFSQIMHY